MVFEIFRRQRQLTNHIHAWASASVAAFQADWQVNSSVVTAVLVMSAPALKIVVDHPFALLMSLACPTFYGIWN